MKFDFNWFYLSSTKSVRKVCVKLPNFISKS